MRKAVYISVPIQKSWDTVLKVITFLTTGNFLVDIWNRKSGSYDKNSIERCDYFLLIPPNNDWRFDVTQLPSGCSMEVKKAIKLGKKIFIAYMNVHATYNIYETELDGELMSGIPGTGNSIFNDIKDDSIMEVEYEDDIKLPVSTWSEYYDPRLLLLM